MNRLWYLALSCGLGVALLTSSPVDATTVSGSFDDVADTSLISSNGFDDLESAQFGSDDAVVRNVAIYALNVMTSGTVRFTSSGYAGGGAQPYLSIFTGNNRSATFFDSSFFDSNIDFDVADSLAVGHYVIAIGVYENLSFAENNGTGTLNDGFTALGDPGDLGSAYYQLAIDSSDATFTIAPADLIGEAAPPSPTTVPEPTGIALVAMGMISMVATRRLRSSFPRSSRSRFVSRLF